MIFISVSYFTLIVIALHIIQTNYDPINQLMSELALGKHGYLMMVAFLALSIAVFTAQLILSSFQNTLSIRLLLVISSVSLLGAGIFKLGAHTILHVTLVAISFVLIVLSMYLLPRLSSYFKNQQSHLLCWGLGVAIAIVVALGNTVLPIGIAQRLAASGVLIWLLWFAVYSNISQS